jgi:alpha-beta hydrolase superfamily lysophospholipase
MGLRCFLSNILGIMTLVFSSSVLSKSLDCGVEIKMFVEHTLSHFGARPHTGTLIDPDIASYDAFIKNLDALRAQLIRHGIDADHAPFINYHSLPTEHVILLVHGLGGTPLATNPLAKKLFYQGHNVVAPVLAGHSSRAQNLYKLAQTPEDTIKLWHANLNEAYAIASRLGKKVIVVAFSMGASLSLDFLTRMYPRPKNLAGLVLLAPAFKESIFALRHSRTRYRLFNDWLQLNPGESPEKTPLYWATDMAAEFKNDPTLESKTFVNGEYVRIPTHALRFIPAASASLELESRVAQARQFELEGVPVLAMNSDFDNLVDTNHFRQHAHLFNDLTEIRVPAGKKVHHYSVLVGHPEFDPMDPIKQWITQRIYQSPGFEVPK